MAREVGNANTSYFKVDADGFIYLASKVEMDGYKPHYNDEGKLTGYRKLFTATDEGKIVELRIRNAKFQTGEVPMVSISIDGKDGRENIQFQLYTMKKGLSPYAKALAQVLPNVDFEKTYSISFDKRKDDRGYTVKNIYFNHGENESVKAFHKYLNKEGNNGGDIPSPTQSEDISGKLVWDFSNQDKYLYKSLKEQLERFEKTSGYSYGGNDEEETSTPAPAPAVEKPVAAKPAKPVAKQVEEDEDEMDLPF
nr:MAG TPA: hypothetical protein [Caudoviricetes sp.]